MRINTRLNNADGNMFDCLEIKYALLGCLAFTNREDNLREMLLYVLLCSARLDEELAGERSIYEIIDHMTGIIGNDYKNCGHVPAEILNSLDKESKLVLFKYMNDSRHFDKLSAGTFDTSRASGSNDKLSTGTFDTTLHAAKQKLEEKFYHRYGDVKEMRVFQPDVYLKLFNDYLTFRLNQISVSIAKELYEYMS